MQIEQLTTVKPRANLIPVRKFGEEGVRVLASAIPFSIEPKMYETIEGSSVKQIVDYFIRDPYLSLSVIVFIGDTHIPRQHWAAVYPKNGAIVSLKIVPQGGGGGGKKNPLATILSIAVMAAAAWAGPLIAGGLGFTAGTTGFSIASALGSALVSTVGNLLVRAIAPPAKQRQNSATSNPAESQTLFIEGARNQLDPYGVIPICMGKHRVVPKLSAGNFTESSGDDQYVRQLFCWGLGKYDLTTLTDNLKIGETAITEYDAVELQHDTDGLGVNKVFTLYPDEIYQDELSVQVKASDGWITRRSQPGANELIIDVTFPNGCVQYDDAGSKLTHTVTLEAQVSVVDSGVWSASQTLTVSTNKSAALRRFFYFKDLAENQYDIRFKRITADASSDKIFDATWLTAIKTVTKSPPVLMAGVSQTAMRIKGTDQLNAAPDQVNSVLFGIIPDWDATTQTWIERATQNPASWYRFILQNSSLWIDVDGNLSSDAPNARGLANDRVYLDNIQDWHEYCTLRGFKYNAYIDYEATVFDMLQEVAASGRAVPTLIDGKWGVVVDREQTFISQHFTTANSWGYSAERVFPEEVHAYRVQFINEQIGYLQDERLVYADGYNKNNATKIEGLQLPGITDPDLIYIHAREHMASVNLRPIQHTFYTDVEYLKAARGSKIKFAHRVPLIGLEDGYVLEVITDESDNITALVLDRPVPMAINKTYSIRTREADTGVSMYNSIRTAPGEQTTVFLENPIPYESETGSIRVDDLFMFGETAAESIDLVVKDIIPDKNLTAKLVCYDAAPEIFQAASGSIPPWESGVTVPYELRRPQAPVIVNIQTGAEVQIVNLDGAISNRMVITLRNDNPFDVIPVVKIKRSDATDYELAQTVSTTPTQVVIEGLDVGSRYDLQIYYKKVGNNSTTMFGGTTNSAITSKNLVLFEGVSDAPPNVTNFRTQVVGQTILLTWDPVTVLDFDHYEIRYAPNLTGVTWDTARRIKNHLKSAETIVSAASGTFLIKAFDRGARGSLVAATTSVSVVIEGMNAVETLTEDPTFSGTHTNTVVTGGTLELDDLTLGTGTYEWSDYIDLGDVYSCFVSPHMVVGGHNTTNTMDQWLSLASMGTMDGSNTGTWSAVTQAAFTDDDPAGTPTWTAWQDIGLGQFTFRAIKFKTILTGNGSNITPAIEELRALIDMPDRIIKATDVSCPNTGLVVTYDPAYKNSPSVNVTIKNAVSGDYLDYTGGAKDNTGFTLIIRNAAGTAVTRTIDYTVVGYGRLT